MKKIWRKFRKMISAKSHSPHERALGAAVGVGIGLLPISPFQIPALVLICMKIKCFRALAFITVWVANPFTYVPIYFLDYIIGSYILQTPSEKTIDFSNLSLKMIFKAGPNFCLSLLIGGIILSIVSTIITYITVLFIGKKRTKLKTN